MCSRLALLVLALIVTFAVGDAESLRGATDTKVQESVEFKMPSVKDDKATSPHYRYGKYEQEKMTPKCDHKEIKTTTDHSRRKLATEYGWFQRGASLIGETTFSRASTVVLSSNGNTLAVGAVGNEQAGAFYTGHVRVFDWTGSAWTQRGQDIDAEDIVDRAGGSVALSANGNIVAIGATGADQASAYYTGEVRVFEWNGTAWVQKGGAIEGVAAYDNVGRSVALSDSGMILAVGAHGVNTYTGAVSVFGFDGTDWVQMGSDLSTGTVSTDFGTSVSLSGDGNTVAAGVPKEFNAAIQTGGVIVYSWDGTAWNQLGDMLTGVGDLDSFGEAVSLSTDGMTVAVGASGGDSSGDNNSGKVEVFYWTGSAWVQLGSTMFGANATDLAGFSVAISGDASVVAIGSPQFDSLRGHVRSFMFSGTDWVQIGDHVSGDELADELGTQVSLSEDGSVLAVGAHSFDEVGKENAGLAKVFDLVDITPSAVPTAAPTEFIPQTAVIETLHPYGPNLNQAWEVEFPDVNCYDLIMDPKSYTPDAGDYAKIYTFAYIEGSRVDTQIGSQKEPKWTAMALFKNRLHNFGTQRVYGAGVRVEFASDAYGANHGLQLTVSECPPSEAAPPS